MAWSVISWVLIVCCVFVVECVCCYYYRAEWDRRREVRWQECQDDACVCVCVCSSQILSDCCID